MCIRDSLNSSDGIPFRIAEFGLRIGRILCCAIRIRGDPFIRQIAAVSYTHLDVYKRQTLESEDEQFTNVKVHATVDTDSVNTNNTCLLYTSRCV